MKSRTKARCLALQALFEIDLTGHQPGVVLQERLVETPLDVELEDFARNIIQGVLTLTEILDETIAKHAPEWPLDQVAVIDRNILRIALWEFAIENKTPIKVVINEAVEIAKLYGSDSAPRFINGVLGSLASHQNEITQTLLSQKKKNENKTL